MAVGYVQQTYAFSQRRACRVVGAHRRTMRYQRRVREDEDALRTRLRSLAGLRSRWGYRRLHVLLQREVGRINHKRVYRLYREERLALRRRKRKRVAYAPRGAVEQSWKRGEARRSLEYGLHARCAHRWPTVPDPQHSGSGHARVLGAGGRYLLTGSASHARI